MYRQVAEYERRAIEAMEIEEEENAKVVLPKISPREWEE